MDNQEMNTNVESISKEELKEMFETVLRTSTEEDVEEAENGLSLKYGCGFTATHIGGRIDSDTTTLLLVPDFDETLVVKAVLDAESRELTDNLIDRLVGRSFSEETDASLNKKDVRIASWATFVCGARDREEDDINITLQDFTEKYHPEDVLVYFALDEQCIDNRTAQKLTETFAELSKKYQTTVVLYGVIILEDYKKCAEQIKEETDLTSTWFYNYQRRDAFQYAVTDGRSNLSVNDLQAILNGE